jgi:hypothetical protein
LQQELSEWANDGAPGLTTLWLNGMAGTGKSAISTTFSRNMDDEGFLGATFFIDRQVADRADPRRIVQSLAYDLAERDTNRLRALWLALRAKPTIKEMPLREQVQALIKRPLDATCSETLVIVIDGLDECAPSNGTQLLSTLVDCLAGFQIKLLVSSRSRFALIPHKPILLQEQPLEEVEKDVRLYWEHSLDGLCPPRGDADWRHSVSLDRLADLTGHLFIYAATILKIVQNFKHNRVEELTKLLRTSNSSPETDKRSVLNDLYLGILSRAVSNYDGTVNPRSVHHLRDILEVVIFARYPLTSRALVQLLDIETDVLDGYLATLVSVLVIPDTNSADGVIRPLHQSFPDFVCQYSGSVHHDLAIDTATANVHLSKHCFARLNKELHFDMCNIGDPSLFNNEVEDLEGRLKTHVPLALRYSCEFWPVHCLSGMPSTDLQCQVPLGLVEFCYNHLLHWIELLSLIDSLNIVPRDISKLLEAFKVTLAISSQ